MPQHPKRFRISARNIFLTYPHCLLSKEEALHQLVGISLPRNKKFIRVAKEILENGSPYLHVLIQLEGKAQITNNRIFDLTHASSTRTYHPSIRSARSSSDVKACFEKEGEFADWGQFQIDGRSSRVDRMICRPSTQML